MTYQPPPCEVCLGLEWTCENHPTLPWAGVCCDDGYTSNVDHACCPCGAAGQPCPACNDRPDGSISLGDGSYAVPIR